MVNCFMCFVKQKTAYEMRISDWSSDVCSSDLVGPAEGLGVLGGFAVDAQLPTVGVGRREEDGRAGRELPRPAQVAVLLLEHGLPRLAELEVDRRGAAAALGQSLGRSSGRERVGKYVEVWWVDGT